MALETRKEPPTLANEGNAFTGTRACEDGHSGYWSNASPQLRYSVSAIHDHSPQCQQASDIYCALLSALAPGEGVTTVSGSRIEHRHAIPMLPNLTQGNGKYHNKLWDRLQQEEEESPKSGGLAINPWKTLD